MKLKLLIIAIIFCKTLAGQVNYGISAGVHTVNPGTGTNKIPTRIPLDSISLTIQDSDYGFHVGGFLRLRRNNFYFQPEVFFNTSKINYRLKGSKLTTVIDSFRSERFLGLTVPMILGMKLSILRVNAGPVLHYTFNNISDLKDVDGFESKFEQAKWGYQLGVGFDFSPLYFDLRHEGNFYQFGEHINFFGKEYSFSKRPTRLIATLSYKF